MNLDNFKWQSEGEPQNFLSYIFFLTMLIYGVVFTFFPMSGAVQATALATAIISPIIWGAACLTIVAMALYSIASRRQWVAEATGMLGFLIWVYGFSLYILLGAYFAAFVVYFPQMLFWTFWYVGVKRYHHRQRRASVTDNTTDS